MPNHQTKQSLTQQHSHLNDLLFRLKSAAHIGKRIIINQIFPVKKFKIKNRLSHDTVIATSESELWNPDDNQQNWILTAGKIQNLRIAAQKINGLEIKKNQTFSFWKHIGNPNIFQNYVIGREIREGCIVPTIAGGLCQLSNALYDAAIKADFEIVERHKHTKVIKGSLAEQNRDATVKWNYLDLRFRSKNNFNIVVELTSNKLIVQFKTNHESSLKKTSFNPQKKEDFHSLNDCYSCGNIECHKHLNPQKNQMKQQSQTTFILDERWPEFEEYINKNSDYSDLAILTLKPNKWIKTQRYNWNLFKIIDKRTTFWASLLRAIVLRLAPKIKNNVFELMLKLDRIIAKSAAKKIPISSTHLVISSNLLPFIYETGALGGRTYDVLMTRLPFEKIHEKLDRAYQLHPNSKTLKDFRAPQKWVDLENKALNTANKIISPHTEIIEMFKNKIEILQWYKPIKPGHPTSKGTKILFPGSVVGRKGAYEMRELARALNFQFVYSGKTIEDEQFWEGLNATPFDGNYRDIKLIIYPTVLENQPRQLLYAISRGIQIITTPDCGIKPTIFTKYIELSDTQGWLETTKKYIDMM